MEDIMQKTAAADKRNEKAKTVPPAAELICFKKLSAACVWTQAEQPPSAAEKSCSWFAWAAAMVIERTEAAMKQIR